MFIKVTEAETSRMNQLGLLTARVTAENRTRGLQVAELSVGLRMFFQGLRAVKNEMSAEFLRIMGTTKEDGAKSVHCTPVCCRKFSTTLLK